MPSFPLTSRVHGKTNKSKTHQTRANITLVQSDFVYIAVFGDTAFFLKKNYM